MKGQIGIFGRDGRLKDSSPMRQARVALSEEQQGFIDTAKTGKNILVDACIGSGKTTAIQRLCEGLSPRLSILYLTYNKLLKLDAKQKIRRRNVTVTNYHGYAYARLKEIGVSAGVSDLIRIFLDRKPPIPAYDVLVLDEYQDISEELAEMLLFIKSANPRMQIVAVGDMDQKIYDYTSLDVPAFIENFLGEHVRLTFTKCFRLSPGHAARLGKIWGKRIEGTNEACTVSEMDTEGVTAFLSAQEPRDILCLGGRTGTMTDVLNDLEEKYPGKFNKRTVYASIRQEDGSARVPPGADCAIFTTFDSSKGLERKICAVFDHTESYWETRISNEQQSYEILRNIFCVAASRGKNHIIFVTDGETLLSDETLMTKPEEEHGPQRMEISELFDFKYREDVEAAYALLDIRETEAPGGKSEILIRNTDGLIDLSPCIGIYQEACFFTGYDIDADLKLYFEIHRKNRGMYRDMLEKSDTLDKKILLLTALETRQNRYVEQVAPPFVGESESDALRARLSLLLSPDEDVQVPAALSFYEKEGDTVPYIAAMGFADAVQGDTVYELKFVSELMHEHFLQCACYAVALGKGRGILWNTRKNRMYEIRVPDRKRFLDTVARAASKRRLDSYCGPDL